MIVSMQVCNKIVNHSETNAKCTNNTTQSLMLEQARNVEAV